MRILSSIGITLAISTTALFADGPAQAASVHVRDSGAIPSILPNERPVEPVLMLVSLDNQSMRVIVGDEIVARTHVSTGKQGHRTPTGIFSILEKRRHHKSNIYSQAPMPFMQRLTWSGIALHESDHVPDYPASHGCIRMPGAFAKQLFGFTGTGAHVLITEDERLPRPIAHNKLFYPGGKPAQTVARSAAITPVVVKPMNRKSTGSMVVFGSGNAESGSDADTTSDNLELRSSFDAHMELVDADDGFVMPSSRDPIRILITQRTGRELVRDIQSMLNQLGFEAGSEDGLIGSEMGDAILRYQRDRELEPTGAVSVALARELSQDTGRGGFSTGHIYVRQGFRPLFDAPVFIDNPTQPLGTHFLSAIAHRMEPDKLQWQHMQLADSVATSPLLELDEYSAIRASGVHATLDRVHLPQYVRSRLLVMTVAGSSIVIADGGINDEAHKGTDFIVVTNNWSD
ncbi:L,D-transpeptidase family protein [Hoeflea poritis]|uniref:L,D-transpeptidase family protein n=1 Tax=Hoeflea poritis TaxID=2993659 RepID=A0ABT4VS02_9HYPH|nr:L,D-transpeptidase family protein [Hoeflea poritis]MDA4846975.1 L,D-transpeptidase family protein [Hoeflea poritis]